LLGLREIYRNSKFYSLTAEQQTHCYTLFIVTPPPIGVEEYCDERVCVSVCPRAYLRNYIIDLNRLFVLDTYGHGSVFLWRRFDTVCTSGLMDDVMFAHLS